MRIIGGLDLSDLDPERTPLQRLARSRGWDAAMDRSQFGGLPVVAVVLGAVIGGCLELASACHVRVADL